MHTLGRHLRLTIVVGVLTSSAALTPAQALCPGDCNGDGLVTANEVIRGLNIPLGFGAYRTCPTVDVNSDHEVTIDELVVAVKQALTGCPATVAVNRAPEQSAPAGPLADGSGILPSGRRVTPTGRQLPTETLPLNVALTADDAYLLVTNDGSDRGNGKQYVQVVDTHTLAVTETAVPHFFGLAVTPAGDRVFVGSDNDSGPDLINALDLSGGALTLESQPVVTFPDGTFPSGLALSPDGTHLYALGLRGNDFLSIDLTSQPVSMHAADANVGKLPFQVVVSPDGTRAYVSSWGINGGAGSKGDLIPAPLPPLDPNAVQRSSIGVVDLSNPNAPHFVRYLPIARSVKIDNKVVYGGSHPSAMRLSPDGKLLYVTATNDDLLVVLDTVTLATVAEVPLNVFTSGPLAAQPAGLYPNALAVSPDGTRVYVADAGINAVQVVAVDPTARTFTPAGFIPTGWYPSALALSSDGTRLYVANGKGIGVGPNGGAGVPVLPSYYIGALLKGSISVIDHVVQYDLQAGTAQTIANNGLASNEDQWVDGTAAAGQVERANPVPIEFGSGPSDLIQYVVFIFKENRTYDQVLGKLPGGDGDPELTDYGPDVTPNTNALAQQFATGDNFFNDGEVSETGHDWADQANCTDFMEKLWPANYDRNLPSDVLDYGQERFAKGGFIFQSLDQQGIPFRVYGETMGLLSRFAAGTNGGGVGSLVLPLTTAFKGFPTVDDVYAIVNGNIDSLQARGVDTNLLSTTVWPHQMLQYPMNIISSFMDTQRAQLFISELDGFTASGSLPNFIFVWLPNDHTFGTSQSDPTPRSAIADNDAGMGMIIDALSHSPFWPHMAIFVTEDDPQGGQDHVSAHRTISLIASPYVRHGYISHVHHSSMSMTKTMELLLGAQPMTQFDRYATAMRDYFTNTPDLTPYTALPRTFPPETNPPPSAAPNRYLRRAAQLSASLNLRAVDEDGEKMARILALVRLGERVELQKARAVALTVAALAALLVAGATLGRRYASAAASKATLLAPIRK